MVKFTFASPDGSRTGIGLGLTRENVRRLKKDQPIKIDLSELGLSGEQMEEAEVVIFYGKDEGEIARKLEPFIGSSTDVKTPINPDNL